MICCTLSMSSAHRLVPGASPEALAGQTFGRYRVLRPLQRGGMGEVLLAEALDGEGHGTKVVLKRLLPSLIGQDSFDAMFAHEARLMSLLDHPNIVRVVDQPVISGQICLALELVQGRNLHQTVRRLREKQLRCPPQIALYILRHALYGLEHAHRAKDASGQPLGIVHRDVTPGNILLSFDGAVKVTDFGIAKSATSGIATAVGLVKGTTRYLSPEQVRGWPLSARSDVYSAAVVLTELLTGEPLFSNPAVAPTLFQIVRGERPPIASRLPFQAARLAATLERALSVLPEDRPESAARFAALLYEDERSCGPPLTAPEIGAFVRRLFFDNADVERFELQFGDALDLTYLVEVDDGVARELDFVPQKVVEDAREALGREGPPPVPLLETSFERVRDSRVFRRTVPVEGAYIEAQRSDPPEGGVPTEPPPPPRTAAPIAERARRSARPSWQLGIFLAGILLGAASMFGLWLSREAPAPRSAYPVVTLVAEPLPDPEPPPLPAEPVRAEPVQVEPVRGEPVRGEPVQVEPVPVEPVDARPGKLVVRGPRGAKIKVDGVARGRAPLLGLQIEPGRRTITIQRRGGERSVVVEVPPASTIDATRDPIQITP